MGERANACCSWRRIYIPFLMRKKKRRSTGLGAPVWRRDYVFTRPRDWTQHFCRLSFFYSLSSTFIWYFFALVRKSRYSCNGQEPLRVKWAKTSTTNAGRRFGLYIIIIIEKAMLELRRSSFNRALGWLPSSSWRQSKGVGIYWSWAGAKKGNERAGERTDGRPHTHTDTHTDENVQWTQAAAARDSHIITYPSPE